MKKGAMSLFPYSVDSPAHKKSKKLNVLSRGLQRKVDSEKFGSRWLKGGSSV